MKNTRYLHSLTYMCILSILSKTLWPENGNSWQLFHFPTVYTTYSFPTYTVDILKNPLHHFWGYTVKQLASLNFESWNNILQFSTLIISTFEQLL